ncbi:uncharacterized protein ACHE_10983S [Aspergillus chevalieri]|uniref:Uncharacterized protein n=1 Tax=Aspergillus chevalieri TaxID=182096 RepID=A0A7R7VEY6_ASPCH|nr:uncharacterized protein ACHE_10983S [Aspergillus chevalieri]BCR83581.1 hypothetical protein ACHE_10983S [Aspergillus chevalieri]
MEELGELCSTRAIDIQDGTLDKGDFLRQVAHFIILNKDHLPDNTRLSLLDAFGKRKRSSSTKPNRSRGTGARERIEEAREIDIMPSSQLLRFTARIEMTPADLWTVGLSVDLDWDKKILRHIYRGNRQNDRLAVLLFYQVYCPYRALEL